MNIDITKSEDPDIKKTPEEISAELDVWPGGLLNLSTPDMFEAKLGFTMALFNILVQWHGFQPDENGFFALSIAEFSL